MTPPIWGRRKRDYNADKDCHPRNYLEHQDYYSHRNWRSTNRLTCPMPKALTASLLLFDYLTEIQSINYFHSLLRGNALQAYCDQDDAKKDNLEEVITAFKRRFGDFQSSGRARWEWDSLHFDPTKQQLHELLDTLQKQLRKR